MDDARQPGRPTPAAPLLAQSCSLDFSIPVEDLVDRLDYKLSRRIYLGAAFPSMIMDSFGPGVMASFMGARIDDSSGQIWFHPPRDGMSIEDIHLEFNPDHPVLDRIIDIYRACHRRWKGQVQLGHTDWGGNLDLVAHFRTSEALLIDLYDSPDEVVRCLREIHVAWWKYFDLIQEVIQPENPGCTNWLDYFSPRPTYTTQCDFSYMISPKMFAAFALPELRETWAKLDISVYHLDGIGQRAHLPLILEDRNLSAVQWVPGDGQPDETQWPEIYQSIARAGKKIICNNPCCIPAIAGQTQTPGLVASSNRHIFPASRHQEARDLLKECGYG
jgi:5-methyltetrahydrofolate--homocysteine methyltransferase